MKNNRSAHRIFAFMLGCWSTAREGGREVEGGPEGLPGAAAVRHLELFIRGTARILLST